MRFSPELVQIKLCDFPLEGDVLTDLLHVLASHQINLSFLCLDASLGTHVSFCMTKTDFAIAEELIHGLLHPLKVQLEIIQSIGSLTLFPHQSRLAILGRMLSIFGQHKIPVYSLSSSISTLAINTDFCRLDRAAELLQTVFHLPRNHTPFRQHLPESISNKEAATCQKRPIVQTAATYYEPVIGIYGSNTKTGLVMATLNISDDRLLSLGNQLEKLVNEAGCFELAIAHRVADKTLQLVLLYEAAMDQSCGKSVADIAPNCAFSLTVVSPVDLLYFHGPHFQDRFGVADAALTTLNNNNFDVLATGCSGTSIYLVTPEKMAHKTNEILKTVFLVPNIDSGP